MFFVGLGGDSAGIAMPPPLPRLVKRRGAAESSMDFTISLPRFARRRVPRFARLGLASLAWGSLRSPGVLISCTIPRVVPVLLGYIASNKYLYRTGGPNIPVTLKHITGICRKCVNLQLGYCSHCPFMDTEGL